MSQKKKNHKTENSRTSKMLATLMEKTTSEDMAN